MRLAIPRKHVNDALDTDAIDILIPPSRPLAFAHHLAPAPSLFLVYLMLQEEAREHRRRRIPPTGDGALPGASGESTLTK